MLPDSVQAFIDAEIAANTTDFSDLRAVFLNGTLKRSPETSHTEGLLAVSRHIFDGLGVRTDVVRAVDHTIPPGVYPQHAGARLAGGRLPGHLPRPHRTGQRRGAVLTDLARRPVLHDAPVHRAAVRLVGDLNTAGQWSYYGKVGGVLITGNEDGGKHCAAQMLYAPSHIGFTIPPQADSYWTGEAGPGPSYLDDNRGAHNHWTTRNTVFAAWNMLHTARRLKDAGGLPARGNITTNWDLGNPEHPNPEYR